MKRKKSNKLHKLESQGLLDEVESEMNVELGMTQNDSPSGDYLSSYDAKQNNNYLNKMKKEENDDK